MGAIYGQAVVNIAADWGQSAESGCYNQGTRQLVSRNGSRMVYNNLLSYTNLSYYSPPTDYIIRTQDNNLELTISLSNGAVSTLYLRLELFVSSDGNLPEIVLGKLMTRAWALQ